VLNPTPPEGLTDDQGRPYFLWDCDLTLEQFERGLHDPDPEVRSPRKDAGFSPLTLAWVLKSFAPATLARALGLGPAETEEITAFHRQLQERIVAAAAPE